MYEYKAEIVRVIDGDTIVCNIDLGFNTWIRNEHIRLARINAPESRTRDLEEKARGNAATEFVLDMIANYGKTILLRTEIDKGKFGRYIGEINFYECSDMICNLNDMLVENGHAEYVEY